MPAYFDTGFSVREPMWHGEGLVLDEYPTDWLDARTKAGLTWEPEERTPYILRAEASFRACPVCAVTIGGQHTCEHNGAVTLETCIPFGATITEQGIFVPVPQHKMIVRNDTELVLGVRSDDYQAIYHSEDGADDAATLAGLEPKSRASMEQIIEAMVGSGAKFETAGSCREGRYVWALMYLDEPFQVPGDPTQHIPFIAVLNHHDGSGGCKVIRTMVRVVCWNTFQMASADAERTGLQFSFRHVGDVRERIEEAREQLAGLRNDGAEYVALAEELSALSVTDSHVKIFLTEFLPSPRENGQVCSDRVHGNVERARDLFTKLYTESVTTEGIRGNAFGLLQTATEYLDHARGYRNSDTYLGRSILRPEPAKAKALATIRRVVK